MPTTTLMTCREHDDCVVELVLDATDAPLAPPVWAQEWVNQADGQLTEISHIPAARSADGLLLGTQALLEMRIARLEHLKYRRHWWQIWRRRK